MNDNLKRRFRLDGLLESTLSCDVRNNEETKPALRDIAVRTSDGVDFVLRAHCCHHRIPGRSVSTLGRPQRAFLYPRSSSWSRICAAMKPLPPMFLSVPHNTAAGLSAGCCATCEKNFRHLERVVGCLKGKEHLKNPILVTRTS